MEGAGGQGRFKYIHEFKGNQVVCTQHPSSKGGMHTHTSVASTDRMGIGAAGNASRTGGRVASLAARDAEGRRTHASSNRNARNLGGLGPGRRRGATGVTRLSGALPPLARRWLRTLHLDGLRGLGSAAKAKRGGWRRGRALSKLLGRVTPASAQLGTGRLAAATATLREQAGATRIDSHGGRADAH